MTELETLLDVLTVVIAHELAASGKNRRRRRGLAKVRRAVDSALRGLVELEDLAPEKPARVLTAEERGVLEAMAGARIVGRA